jgi:hypothetical protein
MGWGQRGEKHWTTYPPYTRSPHNPFPPPAGGPAMQGSCRGATRAAPATNVPYCTITAFTGRNTVCGTRLARLSHGTLYLARSVPNGPLQEACQDARDGATAWYTRFVPALYTTCHRGDPCPSCPSLLQVCGVRGPRLSGRGGSRVGGGGCGFPWGSRGVSRAQRGAGRGPGCGRGRRLFR